MVAFIIGRYVEVWILFADHFGFDQVSSTSRLQITAAERSVEVGRWGGKQMFVAFGSIQFHQIHKCQAAGTSPVRTGFDQHLQRIRIAVRCSPGAFVWLSIVLARLPGVWLQYQWWLWCRGRHFLKWNKNTTTSHHRQVTCQWQPQKAGLSVSGRRLRHWFVWGLYLAWTWLAWKKVLGEPHNDEDLFYLLLKKKIYTYTHICLCVSVYITCRK